MKKEASAKAQTKQLKPFSIISFFDLIAQKAGFMVKYLAFRPVQAFAINDVVKIVYQQHCDPAKIAHHHS